eukprot:572584-Pyramimonas_sp.AAC.2
MRYSLLSLLFCPASLRRPAGFQVRPSEGELPRRRSPARGVPGQGRGISPPASIITLSLEDPESVHDCVYSMVYSMFLSDPFEGSLILRQYVMLVALRISWMLLCHIAFSACDRALQWLGSELCQQSPTHRNTVRHPNLVLHSLSLPTGFIPVPNLRLVFSILATSSTPALTTTPLRCRSWRCVATPLAPPTLLRSRYYRQPLPSRYSRPYSLLRPPSTATVAAAKPTLVTIRGRSRRSICPAHLATCSAEHMWQAAGPKARAAA